MPQAKTVMKKEVVTIHPEVPLDDVIDILIQHNITGVPVVNEDNTIAGMLTEKDILRFLVEQDVMDFTNNRILCETTAYHIMTTDVVAFDQDTPLTEVCAALVSHNFRRVPIIDKNAQLVGIISRKDIIAIIT